MLLMIGLILLIVGIIIILLSKYDNSFLSYFIQHCAISCVMGGFISLIAYILNLVMR